MSSPRLVRSKPLSLSIDLTCSKLWVNVADDPDAAGRFTRVDPLPRSESPLSEATPSEDEGAEVEGIQGSFVRLTTKSA